MRTRPRVIGLDLSLTGTGVAGAGWAVTIRSAGRRGASLAARRARLHTLASDILDYARGTDLAVIEGPSYGSSGAGTWDRAGLWWLVVDGLAARDIPVAQMAPQARAKYATGDGRSGKAVVLAAMRTRYGIPLRNDNEADALALCAAGMDWAGWPLAPVPDSHRQALARVEWPIVGPPALQLGLDGGTLPQRARKPRRKKRTPRVAVPVLLPAADPEQLALEGAA